MERRRRGGHPGELESLLIESKLPSVFLLVASSCLESPGEWFRVARLASQSFRNVIWQKYFVASLHTAGQMLQYYLNKIARYGRLVVTNWQFSLEVLGKPKMTCILSKLSQPVTTSLLLVSGPNPTSRNAKYSYSTPSQLPQGNREHTCFLVSRVNLGKSTGPFLPSCQLFNHIGCVLNKILMR